jgi:4-hydroxy-3-methylbut-2-enyl diphosphate reductase
MACRKPSRRGPPPRDGLCRCDLPLVSKVHIEAERHHENGLQMVMIGHAGHPEVLGTMGQLPEGEVLLVETVEDVAHVTPRDPQKLAFITQTTLSVDDTAGIVAALAGAVSRHHRPAQGRHLLCHDQPAGGGQGGRAEDRRASGDRAPNSSNSKRLVEVGRAAGCAYAQLVQRARARSTGARSAAFGPWA